MKMYLIGLGTGRCGTRSLARLINKQNGWHCTHEMKPVLPWRKDEKKFGDRMAYFKEHDQIGDVGFYYLPYVEDILNELSNLKVVSIKRDMQETVESFMKKIPHKNHWVENKGKWWRNDPLWDRCFPNLGLEDRFDGRKLKRESIKQYWRSYYEQVEWLSDMYLNKVKVYPIDVLNDRGLQKDMFNFIGVDNPNIKTGIRKNEG